MRIGTGVVLGRGVRFDVRAGGAVTLGDGVVLGNGCRIHAPGGLVRIAAGAVLGDACAVVAHERVEVGARALLADEVVLVDTDHRFDDPETPIRDQGLVTTPITIGAGARVGPGTVVLRGTVVAPGEVVGAHRVLRRPPRPAPAAAAPPSGAPSPP